MNIDLDTGASTTGCFTGGAGQSSRTHVLDSGHAIGGEELKAGFKKELFTERVTHLNSGTICLGLFGQLTGCEGGTGKAVAARFGTDIKDGIAHPLGRTAGDLLMTEDPQTESID